MTSLERWNAAHALRREPDRHDYIGLSRETALHKAEALRAVANETGCDRHIQAHLMFLHEYSDLRHCPASP